MTLDAIADYASGIDTDIADVIHTPETMTLTFNSLRRSQLCIHYYANNIGHY